MNASWIRYLPSFIRQKIEGRQQLQQAIGNTGWLLGEKILRMGIGLLVSIWVTRYLGPEQFGQLNYATAFVMVLTSFTIMQSLDVIVVRNIVRDPTRTNEIMGSSFVLKLVACTIAFGITLTSIVFVRHSDYATQLLVGIIAFGTFFQPFCIIDFWFQARVQSKYPAIVRSSAFLLTSSVKVALVLFKAPLLAFAVTAVIDIAITSLGLVMAYRMNEQHMKDWRATPTMLKDLMMDSWPLVASEIFIMAYMRVDKILLGEMAGSRELGIYSAATMIAEAFYFIPTAVCTSIFPSLIKAGFDNKEQFDTRLQQIYNLMSFLGYAVALPVTILAVWVVPFMFGSAYTKAGPMLIGLAWAGLFINLMIVRSYYLTVMNWTRLHLVIDVLCCLLNVSLNLYLIPLYGGMGAVVATIISYWFVAHGSCYMFKPLLKTGNMMSKALIYPKIW